MATFGDLKGRLQELATLTRNQKRHSLTAEQIDGLHQQASDLYETLRRNLPPTAQEKKRIKADPIAAQIVKQCTGNTERKQIFDLGFFRKLYNGLPRDKKAASSSEPKTAAAYRDAIMVYYARSVGATQQEGLKKLRDELDGHYDNHPVIQERKQAAELLRRIGDLPLGELSATLKDRFPRANELRNFARHAGLTPPKATGKGKSRKTAHESLAEAIHADQALGKR